MAAPLPLPAPITGTARTIRPACDLNCNDVRVCLSSILGLPTPNGDIYGALDAMIENRIAAAIAALAPIPPSEELLLTLAEEGTAIGAGGTTPLNLALLGTTATGTIAGDTLVPAALQPVAGGTVLLTGVIPDGAFTPDLVANGGVGDVVTLTGSTTVTSAGVTSPAGVLITMNTATGAFTATLYDPASGALLNFPAGLVDPSFTPIVFTYQAEAQPVV